MAKRIVPQDVPSKIGSDYPAPFHEPCATRERRRLGDVAGLTQFGVNLMRLPPGAWSSQRHWHHREDEFVYVVSGEVTLMTDSGEEVLRAGEAAGFRAGDPDGHHLVNRSETDALVLEIGSRAAGETAEYSDIDMRVVDDVFVHRDGRPYPPRSS